MMLAVALLFCGTGVGFAQTYDRGTANYYAQDAEKWIGKSVSVFATHAMRLPKSYPAPEDYTAFVANTASMKTANGGDIIIYVRTMRADAFEKKYKEGWIINGVPKTKQFSGKYMKAVEGSASAVYAQYAIMMN